MLHLCLCPCLSPMSPSPSSFLGPLALLLYVCSASSVSSCLFVPGHTLSVLSFKVNGEGKAINVSFYSVSCVQLGIRERQYVSLSLSLSVSLISLSFSLCLSHCCCLSLSLPLFLSLTVAVCLLLSLPLFLALLLSVCLSVSLSHCCCLSLSGYGWCFCMVDVCLSLCSSRCLLCLSVSL